jgi:hypothetical protein
VALNLDRARRSITTITPSPHVCDVVKGYQDVKALASLPEAKSTTHRPKLAKPSDLDSLDNMAWDEVFLALVQDHLGFAKLSMSEALTRVHHKAKVVPIFFGTLATVGYASDFSPAIKLEEVDEGGTGDSLIEAAVGMPPSRQYLTVPKLVREQLGIPDVRLSLAATKKSEASIEPGPAPSHVA